MVCAALWIYTCNKTFIKLIKHLLNLYLKIFSTHSYCNEENSQARPFLESQQA